MSAAIGAAAGSLGSVLLATMLLFAPQGGFPLEIREQAFRAGAWSACLVASPEGPPFLRAIPYRQTVYRQGPDDPSPVWLFEEVSTGSVALALGPDGLLFLQPSGEPPRLYFGDSSTPLLLALPDPPQWKKPYRPDSRIALNSGGHISFFDDLLFYGQLAAPDEYVVGLMRIDRRKKRISQSCVSAEISADRDSSAVAYAASIGSPAPIRVRDYVFWRNGGYGNAAPSDPAWNGWKARATRVIDVRTCALLPWSAVPQELLREHAARLAPFLP